MTTPVPGSFDTLPLTPAAQENLRRLGYTTMTPIQAASLPHALAGRDLIAQAKTGSGKTAAFALALLARLDVRRFDVQALVLCPTRELADQVTQEVRRLAHDDRMGLTLQGRTVELRRDQAVVRVGDRTWQLSAPVRVRRGAWLVPADLLPRRA